MPAAKEANKGRVEDLVILCCRARCFHWFSLLVSDGGFFLRGIGTVECSQGTRRIILTSDCSFSLGFDLERGIVDSYLQSVVLS